MIVHGYDLYRFKLPRFRHDDKLVISVDYIVNGDYQILDESKEDDSEIQKKQDYWVDHHFLTIKPFENQALSNTLGANFDPSLSFRMFLNHGQPVIKHSMDKLFERVNRRLVIHLVQFESYAAYDMSQIDSRFGRYAIHQYFDCPDWLNAKLGNEQGQQLHTISKTIKK